MRAVSDILRALPSPDVPRLPAPPYTGDGAGPKVGLAVESMKRHVTDEGWALFAGLGRVGYTLHGHAIGPSLTDVREILAREQPGVVFVQDAREWEGLTAGKRKDPQMRFLHAEALAGRPDVFTLTVIKDAHQQPTFHRDSATLMGAMAWVTPYHPSIVCHLAPYVRPEHLIRTYHTVDRDKVPPFVPAAERKGCLLSGATGRAYPLRTRLFQQAGCLPETTVLKHPGYAPGRCKTPEYLKELSRHKVAICTSSVYGYSLRKLTEATACGCVVVTDLPADDVLPGGIDDNLIRIPSDLGPQHVGAAVAKLIRKYDEGRQRHYAALAIEHFDYRAAGVRLANDIEALRRRYADGRPG